MSKFYKTFENFSSISDFKNGWVSDDGFFTLESLPATPRRALWREISKRGENVVQQINAKNTSEIKFAKKSGSSGVILARNVVYVPFYVNVNNSDASVEIVSLPYRASVVSLFATPQQPSRQSPTKSFKPSSAILIASSSSALNEGQSVSLKIPNFTLLDNMSYELSLRIDGTREANNTCVYKNFRWPRQQQRKHFLNVSFEGTSRATDVEIEDSGMDSVVPDGIILKNSFNLRFGKFENFPNASKVSSENLAVFVEKTHFGHPDSIGQTELIRIGLADTVIASDEATTISWNDINPSGPNVSYTFLLFEKLPDSSGPTSSTFGGSGGGGTTTELSFGTDGFAELGVRKTVLVEGSKVQPGKVTRITVSAVPGAYNSIRWNFSGDRSQLDHFQVYGSYLGIEKLLGCAFQSDSWADAQLSDKRGEIKYRICPVFNDYTLGESIDTGWINLNFDKDAILAENFIPGAPVLTAPFVKELPEDSSLDAFNEAIIASNLQSANEPITGSILQRSFQIVTSNIRPGMNISSSPVPIPGAISPGQASQSFVPGASIGENTSRIRGIKSNTLKKFSIQRKSTPPIDQILDSTAPTVQESSLNFANDAKLTRRGRF